MQKIMKISCFAFVGIVFLFRLLFAGQEQFLRGGKIYEKKLPPASPRTEGFREIAFTVLTKDLQSDSYFRQKNAYWHYQGYLDAMEENVKTSISSLHTQEQVKQD